MGEGEVKEERTCSFAVQCDLAIVLHNHLDVGNGGAQRATP